MCCCILFFVSGCLHDAACGILRVWRWLGFFVYFIIEFFKMVLLGEL